MEKNRSQNRLIYPYLILAIALVCTALILSDLWATVDAQVPFSWEGPTPTPTLWWRTPQAVTPTPPASSGFSSPPASLILGSPASGAPASGAPATGASVAHTMLEAIDG